MRTFTRDLLTGATALVGIIGTAGMLVAFGELDLLAPNQYWFELRLDTARGLSPGAQVTLNGVNVGKVRATTVAPRPEDGVVVRIVVDADRKIPREFDVFLDRSLAGDATLDLGTRPIPPGEPIQFVAEGETLSRKAVTLVDEISARLQEPFEVVSRAAGTFEEFKDAFVSISESLDRVLADRSPEEVDAGAAATIPSTLARLDRALAHADAWLADPALRDDATKAVRDAGELIRTLETTAESWHGLAGDLRAQAVRAGDSVDEAASRIAAAAEGLAGALASIEAAASEVQELAGAIHSGEGTAGRLVRDPDLYRALLDATRRLDQTLEEASLLLETYRKDGLPIRF